MAAADAARRARRRGRRRQLAHQRLRAAHQQRRQRGVHTVSVLVDQRARVVRHRSAEVAHGEGVRAAGAGGRAGGALRLCAQLRGAHHLAQSAGLVQRAEHGRRRPVQRHQQAAVVRVLQLGADQTLLQEGSLQTAQERRQEKLLQPLVGVVDTQLLQTVGLEALESRDVQ